MRNVDIPMKTHQFYNQGNSPSPFERTNSTSSEKKSSPLKRKSLSSYAKNQTPSQKKKERRPTDLQAVLKGVYLFDQELSDFESEEKKLQEELFETPHSSQNKGAHIPPKNSPKDYVPFDMVEDDMFTLVKEIERLNSVINEDRAEVQNFKDKYLKLQQGLALLGIDEEQLSVMIQECVAQVNYAEDFKTFRKESPRPPGFGNEVEKWKTKYFELEKSTQERQNFEFVENQIQLEEQQATIKSLEKKLELLTNENANLEKSQKEFQKIVDLLNMQRNRLEVALEEKRKEIEEWRQRFHESLATEGGDNEVMKYLAEENKKLNKIIQQTQRDLETLKSKAPELKEYHQLNEELNKASLTPEQEEDNILTRTASKYKTPNLSVVEEKLEMTGQMTVEVNTSVLITDMENEELGEKSEIPNQESRDENSESKEERSKILQSEDPSQKILELQEQLYIEKLEARQLKETLEAKIQEAKKFVETKIDLDKLRIENRKLIEKTKAARVEKKMLEVIILELRNQVKVLSQELNNVTRDQSEKEDRGSHKIESLSGENQRLSKLFMEKLAEIQKLNDKIVEYEQQNLIKDANLEELREKISALENQQVESENMENKIFVLVAEIEKLNAIINEKDEAIAALSLMNE